MSRALHWAPLSLPVVSCMHAVFLWLAAASTASAQVVQDSLLAAAGLDARARYGVDNALDAML